MFSSTYISRSSNGSRSFFRSRIFLQKLQETEGRVSRKGEPPTSFRVRGEPLRALAFSLSAVTPTSHLSVAMTVL